MLHLLSLWNKYTLLEKTQRNNGCQPTEKQKLDIQRCRHDNRKHKLQESSEEQHITYRQPIKNMEQRDGLAAKVPVAQMWGLDPQNPHKCQSCVLASGGSDRRYQNKPARQTSHTDTLLILLRASASMHKMERETQPRVLTGHRTHVCTPTDTTQHNKTQKAEKKLKTWYLHLKQRINTATNSIRINAHTKPSGPVFTAKAAEPSKNWKSC